MNTNAKTPRRTVLMTGFPGFISSWLLKALLKEWPTASFFLLVQPIFIEKAEEMLDQMKAPLDQLTILAGDITASRLGMTKQDFQSVQDQITHVLHLAAVYDLGVEKHTAYRVNVSGTKNVLDSIEQFPQFELFVYVSTCYVAGDREGLILETELDLGQEFRNYYEETKFKAELEVRSRMNRIRTIIIRPAIVVGDSKTGAIPKFDGPYYAIKLLAKLEKRGILPFIISLPQIGTASAIFNFVPVDYLINVVLAILRQPGSVGKTFQIADPQPEKATTVFRMALHEFGIPVFGFVPLHLVAAVAKLPGISSMLQFPSQMIDYFGNNAQFDTRNVDQILSGTSISCPHLRDFYHQMVVFTRSMA